MILDGTEAVTGFSGSTVTPACLENLYSFASATAYTNGLMGIVGFLEEWPIKTDLTQFMSSYATEGNTAQSFNCTIVNGGSCPISGTPGVEANLVCLCTLLALQILGSFIAALNYWIMRL